MVHTGRPRGSCEPLDVGWGWLVGWLVHLVFRKLNEDNEESGKLRTFAKSKCLLYEGILLIKTKQQLVIPGDITDRLACEHGAATLVVSNRNSSSS